MDDEAARLEFLAQAEGLADALYADLRLLRRAPAGRERRALLDRAFRHAHTLKASAAALADGGPLVRLAHDLEDLLEAARRGRVPVEEDALDACESAADSLSRIIDALARGEQPDGFSHDDELAGRLRELLREAEARAAAEGSSNGTADPALTSLPEEITSQLNAAERRRLAAALAEGARVVSVRAAFDLEQLDEGFRRLGDALAEEGEIITTLPGEQGASGATARVAFRLVCATDETEESLSGRLAEFGAEVESLFAADAGEPSSGAKTVNASAGRESGGGHAGDARSGRSPSEFVRVPLAELDDLAFAAAELFDDTTAALEMARPRRAAVAAGTTGEAELEDAAARLRQNFLSLEERLLALRMRALAPALERAARAGRSAARAAGKRVEIETAGGRARVDRAVADAVAEPLAHLLRNAVAHGIESPAERRAAGKDERGRVRVEVLTEGARVRVSVQDDGRGVDAALVESAARALGLVEEGARLNSEQALRLIFRPGFSTAADVTETAGRGVGLDAVERAVERAGGEVRVRTRAGRGTTFELHLPLALALAHVVLVRSGGRTYALAAERIAETGRLDASAITSDGARRLADWRGHTLPLVSLAALLGRAEEGEVADGADRVPFVVASLGGADAREGGGFGVAEVIGVETASGGAGVAAGAVAVAVDEVAGRRDALVRGLGRHATRWRGVGGAIDLRDGTVALLLDLAPLLEAAGGEGATR